MHAVLAIKVLMVEDDILVRKSIVHYLEDQGYIILEAANGREGLQLFRQEQPDLVLTDLRMPEMDGLDLLARLVDESPDTPVLVLSGMGTMNDVIEVLQIGAWDYLTKPVRNLNLLLHAVERALERAMLLRGARDYEVLLEKTVDERTRKLQQEMEERSELEKKITLAKRQWEQTVDAIPEPIFLVDKDHRLLRVNKAMADTMGMSPAEAIGKKCYFCVQHDQRDAESCPQDRLMLDEQPHAIEIYDEKLGGHVELQVFPYYDLDNKTLQGAVHIVHRRSAPGSGGKDTE